MCHAAPKINRSRIVPADLRPSWEPFASACSRASAIIFIINEYTAWTYEYLRYLCER